MCNDGQGHISTVINNIMSKQMVTKIIMMRKANDIITNISSDY